jgi:hypothetical protein
MRVGAPAAKTATPCRLAERTGMEWLSLRACPEGPLVYSFSILMSRT